MPSDEPTGSTAQNCVGVGLERDSPLGNWIMTEGGRLVPTVNQLIAEARETGIECVIVAGRLIEVLSDLLTIRDEPSLSRVPVLTVLSQGREEQIAACVRSGAFYCFLEPVDRALLGAMLRAASAVGSPKAEPDPALAVFVQSMPHVKEIVLSVRSLADAQLVSAFVSELCPQPARQALGVSELLLNAIEHGSLEISGQEKAALVRAGKFHSAVAQRSLDPRFAEREVTVWLRRSADHVEIVCEDQGPGFDWKAQESAVLSDADAPCGRGIALSRTLAFDSLEFLGRGNVAVARARLERRSRNSAPNAFAALSSWETRTIELETDRVLERATPEAFFAETLDLALRVSDSPVGFFGYLTESGELVVLTHDESRDGAVVRLAPGQWSRLWWEALEERRTHIENNPHSGFRGGSPLKRSLVVPIAHGDKLLGVVQVANRGRGSPTSPAYAERDAQRLETVARRLAPVLSAWISADLANRRTLELERERARQREEQELARHIVRRLLHEGCLDGPGIRYHLAATAFFNGDLALAARSKDGGLRWMLGDCVGHGLPAALGGLPLSSVFYATAAKNVPMPEVVSTMNDTLLALLPRGFFCAAVLLELSPDGKQLWIWNGGMPPVFVCSGQSERLRQIHSSDLPLGTVPSPELDVAGVRLTLDAGDRILCFSDGLIETQSTKNELFGLERAAVIAAQRAPDEVFGALLGAVVEFRGDNPAFDDLSLVEVTAGAAV
ncbi:MAG: SpoIIE family protein phosphatase [Myxococcota bacterium]|nr:SpoIIE family protein phosphatase [Myxococcota bacterium]